MSSLELEGLAVALAGFTPSATPWQTHHSPRRVRSAFHSGGNRSPGTSKRLPFMALRDVPRLTEGSPATPFSPGASRSLASEFFQSGKHSELVGGYDDRRRWVADGVKPASATASPSRSRDEMSSLELEGLAVALAGFTPSATPWQTHHSPRRVRSAFHSGGNRSPGTSKRLPFMALRDVPRLTEGSPATPFSPGASRSLASEFFQSGKHSELVGGYDESVMASPTA